MRGGIITVTTSAPNTQFGEGAIVTIVGNSLPEANGTFRTINNDYYGFQLEGTVANGTGTGGYFGTHIFTDNPVWVLLDLLVSADYTYSAIDLDSWIKAAAYCDETVNYGNVTQRRYQSSLVLRQRKSAAEVIRSFRQGFNAKRRNSHWLWKRPQSYILVRALAGHVRRRRRFLPMAVR